MEKKKKTGVKTRGPCRPAKNSDGATERQLFFLKIMETQARVKRKVSGIFAADLSAQRVVRTRA